MAHWDIVHSLMSLLHVTECMECKYTYTWIYRAKKKNQTKQIRTFV
jgi:hypothetical protein